MTKQAIIQNWKHATPPTLDDSSWYSSLVGLAYRLYLFKFITKEELEREGLGL